MSDKDRFDNALRFRAEDHPNQTALPISPRPWRYDKDRGYIVDANGEYVHSDQEGLGAWWGAQGNPYFITWAVNRLTDADLALMDGDDFRPQRHP